MVLPEPRCSEKGYVALLEPWSRGFMADIVTNGEGGDCQRDAATSKRRC